MTDIPFGEYFTVETRWDVVAAPEQGGPCSRVRLLKKTMHWLENRLLQMHCTRAPERSEHKRGPAQAASS